MVGFAAEVGFYVFWYGAARRRRNILPKSGAAKGIARGVAVRANDGDFYEAASNEFGVPVVNHYVIGLPDKAAVEKRP